MGAAATSRPTPLRVAPDRLSEVQRQQEPPDRRPRGKARRVCSRCGGRRTRGSLPCQLPRLGCQPPRHPRCPRPLPVMPFRLAAHGPRAARTACRTVHRKVRRKLLRRARRWPRRRGVSTRLGLGRRHLGAPWWRRPWLRRQQVAPGTPPSPQPSSPSKAPPAPRPRRPCGHRCRLHSRRHRREGVEALAFGVHMPYRSPFPYPLFRLCVVGAKFALRRRGPVGQSFSQFASGSGAAPS